MNLPQNPSSTSSENQDLTPPPNHQALFLRHPQPVVMRLFQQKERNRFRRLPIRDNIERSV